jgi:hypothetical protein
MLQKEPARFQRTNKYEISPKDAPLTYTQRSKEQ